MKFLTILSIIYLSSSTIAYTKDMNFNKTIQRMQELRDELRVDEIIDEIDIKVEDKYDEVLVSRISGSTTSSSSSSSSMPTALSFAGINSAVHGVLNIFSIITKGEAYSYEITEIVQDQEHFIKSQKNAQIKEQKLKLKLDQYLKDNMGKIYELKYYHATALLHLINGIKKNMDITLETIEQIHQLGRFISFKGKKNITFCTITNYRNTLFKQQKFSQKTYESSFTPINENLPKAYLNESESSYSNLIVEKMKRRDSDCNYNSSLVHSNPKEKKIYKYSMTRIEKKVQKLERILAAKIIFGGLDSKHTFSFGNSYYEKDYGGHPFSE